MPVAYGAPVLGGQLFATGGDVTVTILQSDARDTSDLYLMSPGLELLIGTNKETGKTVNLGPFPAGTELIFGIRNRSYPGHVFMTGPASRNTDNIVHATVETIDATTAVVGFEDVPGGFDLDFNDNVFSFTSVAINPPPVVTSAADQSAFEATSKLFDLGSFADPGVDGPWSVDVNWGDGSPNTSFSTPSVGSLGTQPHTYPDNGVYPVTVTVTDANSGSTSATFNVTVSNLDPTITAVTNTGPIYEGQSATIAIEATDPAGAADPLEYEFDCDNDGTFEVGPQPSSSTACSFTLPGTHHVPVRVSDGDGGQALGSTDVVVLDDATAPSCKLTAFTNSYIQVTVRDLETGLASITIDKAVNTSVTWPAFTPGTADPLVVTSTKVDLTKSAQTQITVFDLGGNKVTCDPIDYMVIRDAGKPETVTHTDVPEAEGVVTLTNGTPGVKRVEIVVNGQEFVVNALTDGEVVTVDVSSAMQPGDTNTVSITARGGTASSVHVLIWDGIE
jgi:hypothetical protein